MEQINERGCLINQRRGCDSGSPCSSRKSKDGMQEDSDIFIPTACLQQEYVVNLSPGKHRAEGSVPQTMKSTASISGGRLSPSETNGLSAAKGEADAALSFAAGAVSVRIDQEANTRVRRKIDCNLLPWMCGLYLLQYLDKTTLSYASSMGIIKDTGMTAGQYSWTGSIFYIGYLVFEYPHNRMMQRFPVAKYVAVSVVVWGVILAATAGTKDFAGIMTVRFFLGALEGAVTAGQLLWASERLQRC